MRVFRRRRRAETQEGHAGPEELDRLRVLAEGVADKARANEEHMAAIARLIRSRMSDA